MSNGFILLASIALLVVVVLARQIPLQMIGSVVAPVVRPVMRLFRMKPLNKAGSGSVLAAHTGPSAWAALSRASRQRTETERALGDDFQHEEKHLKSQGVLFKWIGVIVGYMRVPTELTDETSERYDELGAIFLNGRVPISANAQNLYEDEDGAIMASKFPEDAGCFYLLNRMRQVINANVRKLTVIFSAIIATVLIVNLIYNDGTLLNFSALFGISSPLALGPFTMSLDDFNEAIFAAVTTIGGAFAMWIAYYVEYAPYQRNNFRELSNFITRYLARLNDHYRTAEGRAKSVTVGQEKDAAKFSSDARKWHTNILWISMRIFFIESFLRGVMFQILRNSGYYLVLVPLLFTVVLAGLNTVLSDLTGFDTAARIADLGLIFLFLFVVMVAVYIVFLRQSMTSIDEINQDEWIGFDSLLVDKVLGDVVGKYAEDVGYWKNRIGGSF
jgi:ABC-type multidrug transport system fused ATPase/permease subunit